MGSVREILRLLACRRTKTQQAVPHDSMSEDDASREYLAVLWFAVRDLSRHWVCEQCVQLHPVDDDVPSSKFYSNSSCKNHNGVVFGKALGPKSKYRIARLHVDLALKYTRMAAAGLDHLVPQTRRRILAGLDGILAPHTGTLTSLSPLSLSVQYTIRPKIVKGRFLVETVWSYLDDGHAMRRRTRDVVKFIHACPHQPFDDSAWTAHILDRVWPLSSNELGRTTRAAAQCRLDDEVSGACPYCRTDFSVEGSQMRAVVRCWRDLGPETSPADPDWRAQLGKGCTIHEPGSVRALYESVKTKQRSRYTSGGPARGGHNFANNAITALETRNSRAHATNDRYSMPSRKRAEEAEAWWQRKDLMAR